VSTKIQNNNNYERIVFNMIESNSDQALMIPINICIYYLNFDVDWAWR
jgi:hypothetical protein